MKRSYVLTREKVVYYRKEVVFDTSDWDQMYDLLESITETEYENWEQVPEDVKQQVLEYFESELADEDLTTDDCYDTEEWCEGNDIDLYEETA